MGNGKAEVKTVQGKDETGTISFEYTLKELKTNKHLLLTKIRCDLVRKTEFFLKSVLTSLSVVNLPRSFCRWKEGYN